MPRCLVARALLIFRPMKTSTDQDHELCENAARAAQKVKPRLMPGVSVSFSPVFHARGPLSARWKVEVDVGVVTYAFSIMERDVPDVARDPAGPDGEHSITVAGIQYEMKSNVPTANTDAPALPRHLAGMALRELAAALAG